MKLHLFCSPVSLTRRKSSSFERGWWGGRKNNWLQFLPQCSSKGQCMIVFCLFLTKTSMRHSQILSRSESGTYISPKLLHTKSRKLGSKCFSPYGRTSSIHWGDFIFWTDELDNEFEQRVGLQTVGSFYLNGGFWTSLLFSQTSYKSNTQNNWIVTIFYQHNSLL